MGLDRVCPFLFWQESLTFNIVDWLVARLSGQFDFRIWNRSASLGRRPPRRLHVAILVAEARELRNGQVERRQDTDP